MGRKTSFNSPLRFLLCSSSQLNSQEFLHKVPPFFSCHYSVHSNHISNHFSLKIVLVKVTNDVHLSKFSGLSLPHFCYILVAFDTVVHSISLHFHICVFTAFFLLAWILFLSLFLVLSLLSELWIFILSLSPGQLFSRSSKIHPGHVHWSASPLTSFHSKPSFLLA